MVSATYRIASFHVVGMDCADEVAALRSVLAPLPGVRDLSFDLMNGKLTVAYLEDLFEPAELFAAVARTGMRAQPWSNGRSAALAANGWKRWGRTFTTTASGLFVLMGFLTHTLLRGWSAALVGHVGVTMPLAPRVLYLAAIAAGAWFVVPKAWLALQRLRPDMNLLMTAAVVGAVSIGEYFEAATVAFLFALSLALESWSVGRARRAIAALLELSPPQARVVETNGRETLPNVANVPVGTRVLVRPGEKFPLDGRVVQGHSAVNQAPITGESRPVPKAPEAEVLAGSINGDGAIEFVTTKLAGDTTLAHIIRLVGEAQRQRAPSEQWVERFARYYTPAVMTLALLVMLIPPVLFGGVWSKWFYEGLVLLIIACPCALVISTPVSIVAALTAAARHGVLVKGGLHLEAAGHIRVVALDKTGTLTEGRPRVLKVIPLSGHTEHEVLAIVAAIESRSEHALARAIAEHAAHLGVQPTSVENYQAIPGKGATALLAGRPVWVGSHRLLEERGQETPELHEQLEVLAATGASVVVVGKDGHVCGAIAIGDRVRPDAKAALDNLRAAGVQRLVMLTGDNRATADAVGRAAGVDEVRAELLPADKVAAVEELVRQYGFVAMIGDGVNDAPALARANLGIAMGTAGTDAAIETADVALMSDDLTRVPWLIRHAHRTLAIIRQNITGSLTVKGLFVLLTFLGQASLWAAIAADMGVSLLVVFNALRLLGPGADRTDRP
jgi:Cd2+/Zn2+-exporting ATPase